MSSTCATCPGAWRSISRSARSSSTPAPTESITTVRSWPGQIHVCDERCGEFLVVVVGPAPADDQVVAVFPAAQRVGVLLAGDGCGARARAQARRSPARRRRDRARHPFVITRAARHELFWLAKLAKESAKLQNDNHVINISSRPRSPRGRRCASPACCWTTRPTRRRTTTSPSSGGLLPPQRLARRRGVWRRRALPRPRARCGKRTRRGSMTGTSTAPSGSPTPARSPTACPTVRRARRRGGRGDAAIRAATTRRRGE